MIATYEKLAGKGFGTGLIVDPASVVRTVRLPASDKDGNMEEVLLIVKPDAQGRISYRAGFAWAADGEITTEAGWLDYLNKIATR
jgi:hypothetical protein